MLINFILHNTKQGKDCSVAAPSKEVLSKHNTPGICAGLGMGGTLKRGLFGWVNSDFFFFKENPNVGLITFEAVIHCLFVCV